MNTQEKDDEIYGKGNASSAEFWEYDTRLGRRWNQDPKPKPIISNYACFANNPIQNVDVKGDEIVFPNKDKNPEFGWKFQEDINILYTTPTGKALIRYLQASEVKIQISDASKFYLIGSWDVKNSVTRPLEPLSKTKTIDLQYYGDGKTKIDGTTAHSYMVLAHEFQHAKDLASGYNNNLNKDLFEKKVILPKGFSVDDVMEMRAMFVANKVAKELGLPDSEIRTHYKGKQLLSSDGKTPVKSFGKKFNPLKGL